MDVAGETWRDRVHALLQAMRDVYGGAATAPSASELTSPQRVLFEGYVHDLRRAKGGAQKRWDAMVAAEFGRTGDLNRAEKNVERRIPLGRVVDPGVIAVVRKYWRECDALNAQLPEGARVRAEDFLLRFLLQSGHDDLAEFLAGLPYWPIGLDAEKHWV